MSTCPVTRPKAGFGNTHTHNTHASEHTQGHQRRPKPAEVSALRHDARDRSRGRVPAGGERIHAAGDFRAAGIGARSQIKPELILGANLAINFLVSTRTLALAVALSSTTSSVTHLFVPVWDLWSTTLLHVHPPHRLFGSGEILQRGNPQQCHTHSQSSAVSRLPRSLQQRRLACTHNQGSSRDSSSGTWRVLRVTALPLSAASVRASKADVADRGAVQQRVFSRGRVNCSAALEHRRVL